MTPRRILESLRGRGVLPDVALAVGVYAGLLLIWRFGERGHVAPWALVFGVPLSTVLLLRRRFPMLVLAGTVCGVVAFLVLRGSGRSPLEFYPAIAAYTVATLRGRGWAWGSGSVAAAILSLAHGLFAPSSLLLTGMVSPALLVLTGTAIGDTVRQRRQYIAAVEERARQAEATRESESQRRVVEERMRIARELHDVLAHHVALISVQAQVAAQLMDAEPEAARRALGHVRQFGNEAIAELRTTVGLLRRSDGGAPTGTEPSPGLDALPRLLEAFRSSGMRVEHATDGSPRPLSARVELAAFRIVQEALTNVSKHAPGATARVRIAYTPTDLSVEIVDDGPGAPEPGSGHGLIGMRERALSADGSLETGPAAGGGFRVAATLAASDVDGEP